VVGTIEDDIKHMVPAADGGWCYAEVIPNGLGNGWANGDCFVAFLITNPDPSLIQHDGSYSRLKVAYGCYQGQIRRATQALTTTIMDPQGKQDSRTSPTSSTACPATSPAGAAGSPPSRWAACPPVRRRSPPPRSPPAACTSASTC
jgi:hypothetical protein